MVEGAPRHHPPYMSSTIIRGGVPSLRLPPSATASAAGPGEASDRAQATRHAARPAADHSWFALFALTRIGAVLPAVALLIADAATVGDLGLAAVASGWACATIVAYALRPALQGRLVAWVLDAAAVLALIAASGDWRSAFYLLALTALIFPGSASPPPTGRWQRRPKAACTGPARPGWRRSWPTCSCHCWSRSRSRTRRR